MARSATLAEHRRPRIAAGARAAGAVEARCEIVRPGAASDGGVTRAFSRTYDAQTGGRAGLKDGGTSPNAVLGSAQDAAARIDALVGIARKAPPADAPGHFRSALELASIALPNREAAERAVAINNTADAKAEVSLNPLAAAAAAAVASGDKMTATRLLKGFDSWQGLLRDAGRPPIAYGERFKEYIEDRVRSGAGMPASAVARTVWFEKRGAAYVYVGPMKDAGVSRVAESAKLFAAGLAIAPAAMTALSGGQDATAAAWRAYSSDARAFRGFTEVFKGRRARGENPVEAFLPAAGFWLRSLWSALWRGLRSLAGFERPYALSSPSGIAALTRDLALQTETAAHGAGVRAALEGAAPTIGSARAALSALSRQAAAHERLRGSGAASGAALLSRLFETAARGRAPSEPLSDGMNELVYGPDGVLRQSSQMARDAAAYVDGRVFPGVGAVGGRHVEGSRLWVQRAGPLRLSADLRATGAGGFIDVRVPGDDAVAARLANLGLTTRLTRGVVTASYDADAADLDAAGMKALAEDALAAINGEGASFDAARDLAVAVDSDKEAARAARARARALDGRVQGGTVVGRVTIRGDEYDAVSAGPVLFLRGADRMPAFAR